MVRRLTGPRVMAIEKKHGKDLREIIKPYLKFKTPVPHIARFIGVSEPTLRFWLKRLKIRIKKR